jgi:hypothetical protein
MHLKGDCYEVGVTPNLELLVTFGMSLEGVCHKLYTQFHYKLIPNYERSNCDQNFLEKSSFQIGCENVSSEISSGLKTCPQLLQNSIKYKLLPVTIKFQENKRISFKGFKNF